MITVMQRYPFTHSSNMAQLPFSATIPIENDISKAPGRASVASKQEVAKFGCDVFARALANVMSVIEECFEEVEEVDDSGDSSSDVDAHPPATLQQWFISHLSHPFPSRSEKRELANSLSLTPRNIDSQLTNWRRRTGWSDIKRNWGKGTKDGMAALVAAYESGKEERDDVVQAMRRVHSYFAAEQVRDWTVKLIARHGDAYPLPQAMSPSPSPSSSQLLSAQSSLIVTPPAQTLAPTLGTRKRKREHSDEQSDTRGGLHSNKNIRDRRPDLPRPTVLQRRSLSAGSRIDRISKWRPVPTHVNSTAQTFESPHPYNGLQGRHVSAPATMASSSQPSPFTEHFGILDVSSPQLSP